MELTVQSFLRSAGGTLESLKERYAINSKRHPELPNLVLLKYNQIESPFSERIVQECRGLILESNYWDVVACPLFKFFNHGEPNAHSIDWSSARVQEKMDGSLAVLWNYAGRWHVSTSGTPDAAADLNGYMPFRQMFWHTLVSACGPDWSEDCLPEDMTFWFELTSPMNRIVVQYPETSLTLLGARRRSDLQEVSPNGYVHLFPGISTVREFQLHSLDDVAATFSTMSPLSQEGYVIVDGNYNRIKVKHPGYVALHHAKGTMSWKALVDIARSGETSEVIAAFPEFKPQLDKAAQSLFDLQCSLESYYSAIASESSQKAFAIQAQGSRLPAALFALRAGKTPSIRQYLADMRLDNLVATLEHQLKTI